MEVPLVVFVNTKSGGLQGTKIIDKLKKCVPVDNVFDLSREGPLPGLQKYRERRFRILVCGGDGSVGWVLTEIEKLKFPRDRIPPVAILPIGTGNDLSRVLKWGGSHPGTKLRNVINKVEKACVVLLDKWAVTYTGDQPMPHTRDVMHNYFSIGADASIALQFHEMRNAHPEKFSSRTQNLAWYVRLGLQNFSSELLHPHVSVEINGEKANVPEGTRCVVVLNLPSYSGGGNPWGSKKSTRRSFAAQSVDDGLLEVVAVNGPMQLVGIHANIIRGKRLGQGNFIRITTTKAIPAQVDGEPWSQPPSVIEIRLDGKSHMLANSNVTHRPEPAPLPSGSSSTPSSPLQKEVSINGIPVSRSASVRQLIRTRSSSAPIAHTPSPLTYGPIQPSKRKKGRMYCDGCGLEFYLPYMLVNHLKSGLCSSGSSSESTKVHASTPPPTLSVQLLGDSTDASSSHGMDSDDDQVDGMWRSRSADVTRRKDQEEPWSSSSVQAGAPSSSRALYAETAPSDIVASSVVVTEPPPSPEPAREPVQEPTKEPVQELAHEPAKEHTQEPAHEPAQTEQAPTPANEPVHEPQAETKQETEPSTSHSEPKERESSQNFPPIHENGADEPVV